MCVCVCMGPRKKDRERERRRELELQLLERKGREKIRGEEVVEIINQSVYSRQNACTKMPLFFFIILKFIFITVKTK